MQKIIPVLCIAIVFLTGFSFWQYKQLEKVNSIIKCDGNTIRLNTEVLEIGKLVISSPDGKQRLWIHIDDTTVICDFTSDDKTREEQKRITFLHRVLENKTTVEYKHWRGSYMWDLDNLVYEQKTGGKL